MPLLLAIEPDSSQAEWIGQQARGPLGAELIVTESVQAAIEAMKTRVPDLILTSLLLSPRDESTLQEYLRLVDAAGVRVQTLSIPMLAEPSATEASSSGMLSVLRKLRPGTPAPSSGGCDPAVFGQQIAEYLEREGKKPQPGRSTPDRGKKAESAKPEVVETQPVATQRPAARERKSDVAPIADGIFAASDRAWRPSAPVAFEEFDTEALLSLLDHVAMRSQGQQPHASGASHASDS